jgi:hypothetical protein
MRSFDVGIKKIDKLFEKALKASVKAYEKSLKAEAKVQKNDSLDDETASEIDAYNIGAQLSPIYWKRDVISADNKADIKAWLADKLRFEGPPPDTTLIEMIGRQGYIERPIILDVDNNVCAEGRHRLTAALKFHLDVPIIMISSTRAKGWKKF